MTRRAPTAAQAMEGFDRRQAALSRQIANARPAAAPLPPDAEPVRINREYVAAVEDTLAKARAAESHHDRDVRLAWRAVQLAALPEALAAARWFPDPREVKRPRGRPPGSDLADLDAPLVAEIQRRAANGEKAKAVATELAPLTRGNSERAKVKRLLARFYLLKSR